jgi:hypothetical protein
VLSERPKGRRTQIKIPNFQERIKKLALTKFITVGITSNARVIRVIQCIGVKADVEGRAEGAS